MDEEADGAMPYSEDETYCLARVWVDMSHNSISSNRNKEPALWIKIANRYNEIRPAHTWKRNDVKLRHHWKRAMKDMKLFSAYYNSNSANLGSGRGAEDILRDAYQEFQATTGRPFKYYKAWEKVRDTPKFLIATGSLESVKRCKNSIDGSYSTESSRGSTPSEEMADSTSFGGYRPRPEGSKAAKANARGKSRMSDSDETASMSAKEKAAEAIANISSSLEFSAMYDIYLKDTKDMSPKSLKRHERMVEIVCKKLGLPPPSED